MDNDIQFLMDRLVINNLTVNTEKEGIKNISPDMEISQEVFIEEFEDQENDGKEIPVITTTHTIFDLDFITIDITIVLYATICNSSFGLAGVIKDIDNFKRLFSPSFAKMSQLVADLTTECGLLPIIIPIDVYEGMLENQMNEKENK